MKLGIIGAMAVEIEALKENISFVKTDGAYVLSFPSTSEIESAEVGDTLYFIQHGGYDGLHLDEAVASRQGVAGVEL